MRRQVQSLASLSGIRIQCSHELWYRSQMQLGPSFAVAQASGYSSDSTPHLGSSLATGVALKRKKKIPFEWEFMRNLKCWMYSERCRLINLKNLREGSWGNIPEGGRLMLLFSAKAFHRQREHLLAWPL